MCWTSVTYKGKVTNYFTKTTPEDVLETTARDFAKHVSPIDSVVVLTRPLFDGLGISFQERP